MSNPGSVRLTSPVLFKLGLVLASIGIITGLAYLTSTDFAESRHNARAKVSAAALVIEEHSRRSLLAIDIVLESAAEWVDERGIDTVRSQADWQQLRQLARRLPKTGAVFIFDQAGDNIAASSSNPPPGGNFNDREWLRQLREGAEAPYIGRVLKGRTIHNLFFPVARSVRGPDGAFIAAVQVGVEVTDIAELFGKLDLGPDGHLGLYRIRDGAIVVRHPMTEALLEESVATLPFFPMLTNSPDASWTGVAGLNGEDRIVAARRVADLPLIAVASLTEAQAYADAQARLVWHVAAAAMLLTAFGALALGALRLLKREVRARLLEVIHLDRVAVVGAMSASIAHELNQPLGAILLNAETAEVLAREDPIDRDQLKEVLADIRKSDERAGDIIRHLRGLLKKRGDVEFEEVDLTNSIRDALHMLEPETRKRGVLVNAPPTEGALLVRADPVHLEQVILNLAANAMDSMQATPAGARKLTVQTAAVGNAEVEVSVSDTGAGIPNDKLKLIFETFYTTKQQGIGLGLSIVRKIVETYGGKIWAENRTDGGAVFRFTLPLSRGFPGIETRARVEE
jgi:C4-dicarboxylate-specific signal transduction histidine kinase